MHKQILRIGKEKNPILIIDNFADNAGELCTLAEDGEPFVAQASDFYPGLRKPAPAHYREYLQKALATDIANLFGLSASAQVTVDLSVYSLVTTPANQLRPIQCVPHMDTQDPSHIAAVHYLCDEKYDGTSFYRHRSTGFESVDASRMNGYFSQLKEEVIQQGRAVAGYINGSTSLFECTAHIELKFNRLILYRGNCLHAGNIDPTLGLTPSPRSGRLTINSFLRIV